MSQFGYHPMKGFTLVEVLVATIILAIGLLGLAALQTIALKDNQDAFFYTQASSLAYELSDRIRANPDGWSSTLPNDTTTDCTAPPSCTVSSPCDTADMADYDYCAWKAAVKSRITADTTATVARANSTTATSICTIDATKVCITIEWARNHQQDRTSLNQKSRFQMEITP